jgi:hypothetical protein
MRKLALALLTFSLAANTAHARSTGDFLEDCSRDESACAVEIKAVIKRLEIGQPADRRKLCLPQTMSDEGLAGEVTYWIGEQMPPLDRQDAAESIAAALVALYSCDRMRGTGPQGDHQ